MVLGVQGVIRLLASEDAGLLAWLNADTSLLIAINVIVGLSGIYLCLGLKKDQYNKGCLSNIHAARLGL